MSWLLLALSLAIFCVAWSVHSPIVMVLCLLVALAALIGFAWLRYKLLFPDRAIAISDTPLTADDRPPTGPVSACQPPRITCRRAPCLRRPSRTT